MRTRLGLGGDSAGEGWQEGLAPTPRGLGCGARGWWVLVGTGPHSHPQGAQDVGPSLLGVTGGNGPVPLPVDGPEAHGAKCCGRTVAGLSGGWGRQGTRRAGLSSPCTVAVRLQWYRMANSPNTSPGPSVRSCRPRCVTLSCPSAETWPAALHMHICVHACTRMHTWDCPASHMHPAHMGGACPTVDAHTAHAYAQTRAGTRVCCSLTHRHMLQTSLPCCTPLWAQAPACM